MIALPMRGLWLPLLLTVAACASEETFIYESTDNLTVLEASNLEL